MRKTGKRKEKRGSRDGGRLCSHDAGDDAGNWLGTWPMRNSCYAVADCSPWEVAMLTDGSRRHAGAHAWV